MKLVMVSDGDLERLMDWWGSSAKSFIDVLRKLAWKMVPGYEEAEWGHPEPISRDVASWSLKQYERR